MMNSRENKLRLEFVNLEIGQKIAVAGIIMPNNWDETGRIIEIALYTNKEEVFMVEHNNLLKKLMNFINQGVEVKGEIKEYPDGRKSITAQSYLLLKESLDDE